MKMNPGKQILGRGLAICLAVAALDQCRAQSSGPSVSEARQALLSRIEQQSGGRITLASFNGVGMKMGSMELNGLEACTVDFEARIEFTEHCRWAARFEGRPLTFKTFKIGQEGPAGARDLIEATQKGDQFIVRGYEVFNRTPDGWRIVGFGGDRAPLRPSDELSLACVTQLKQIGLAFKIWEGDNNDQFPFNLSTNRGGTLELCAPGPDGVDRNGFMHLRAMANELGSPQVLICPADTGRKAAASFPALGSTNVSYQVRSGKNINDSNPSEVLVVCPVHGHVLHADATVSSGESK
jgi:hypothetical protein